MSHKTIASIDMTLDPKSIQSAITQIRHVRDMLVEAMNELIQKLADEGVKEAKAQVVAMDAVDTGELENSIYGYYDPSSRIGYVIAGAPYAFYVEYGTGPIGEDNQHPDPGSAGWAYNIGPSIHQNIEHPEWGVGWYYPGRDGKRHWTNGQPSRPFMYNTMVWLEEAAEALGRTLLS